MDTIQLAGPTSPSMGVVSEGSIGEVSAGAGDGAIDFAMQLVAAARSEAPISVSTKPDALPGSDQGSLLGWLLALPAPDQETDDETASSEPEAAAQSDVTVLVQSAMVLPLPIVGEAPSRIVTGGVQPPETEMAGPVDIVAASLPGSDGVQAKATQGGSSDEYADAQSVQAASGHENAGLRPGETVETASGHENVGLPPADSAISNAAREHAPTLTDQRGGRQGPTRDQGTLAVAQNGEAERPGEVDVTEPSLQWRAATELEVPATANPGPAGGERPGRDDQPPRTSTGGLETIAALNESAAGSVIGPVGLAARELSQWVHQPIVSQVVEGIMQASQRPGRSLRLTLHPEGLGAVSLTVGMNGDRIDVRITVDNAATRDLLQMNLTGLSRALSDQGLSISGAQVDLMGGQARSDASQQQPASIWMPRSGPSEGGRNANDDSVSQVAALTWGTRVDYRV